jgi:hypothetical protein
MPQRDQLPGDWVATSHVCLSAIVTALVRRQSLLSTFLLAGTCLAPARPVELFITETGATQLLPAQVRLLDAQQKPILPADLPHWHDHFVCDVKAVVELTPGRYTYEISRGPEYQITRGDLTVTANAAPLTLRTSLKRIARLADEGWWSGETHLHRGPEQVPLLMQAEDLHIACAHTWWNDGNAWANHPVPVNPLVQFDGNRFYDQLCGEHERGGGALLFIGLKQPLPIVGSQYEYPPAMKFLLMAKEQPGVWVDVEKPFWWDMPVWVANGKVDSVGIAHNHMHVGGVMDNEAWGKSRDRAQYPGPQGNGYWTQDIYYHLLNAGVRLPPSAGSASGVLPNPVGYNRMYAHVDGELTWPKWWESVRRGRVFVSNGPLLRVKANGDLPGAVFQLPKRGELRLKLSGLLDSRDPIKTVEIIRNGAVVQTIAASKLKRGGQFATLTFKESGWFLVRAVADVPETFRFASTAPFYVEAPGQPARVSRKSGQFFLDWVRERMAAIKLDDAKQLDEVLTYQRQAEQFWQKKVSEATCE